MKRFEVLVLLAVLLSAVPSAVNANDLLSCREAFQFVAQPQSRLNSTIELYPAHPLPQVVQPEFIDANFNFDQLMRAFSEGYEADLNDPDQKAAFAIYRVRNLGDSGRVVAGDSVSRVAAEQKAHPDLAKPLFSPVQVHSTSDYVVRPLSVTESPFRSCLGGDCATRSYLTKALQENYIYFTMTSVDGRAISRGQITIALGSAKTPEGKEVAVAFVDKLQHVPEAQLSEVLEAIRQSMANENYLLSMPVSLGDENGIVNYDDERLRIEKVPAYTEQTLVLDGFFATPARVTYKNEHSRAEQYLAVKPLLPLKSSSAQFHVRAKQKPWKFRSLNYRDLIASVYELAKGDVAAKKRFVVALSELRRGNFEIGDQYDEVTLEMMKDKSNPVPLKNLILTELVKSRRYEDIAARAVYLSGADQANLVQNWLQTPAVQQNLSVRPEAFFDMARAHWPTLQAISHRARLKDPTFLSKQLAKIDLKDPLAIQTLRAISQFGDVDLCNQLSSRLPQILGTLEETSGKRARTLLQPIEENLKSRKFVSLEPQAHPATGQLSLSDGHFLPNGDFVRFKGAGVREADRLQWFRNDQLIHEAKLIDTEMGYPGFIVTPSGDAVTALKKRLEVWHDGVLKNRVSFPENFSFGSVVPGRLADGSFLVAERGGRMARLHLDGRSEPFANDGTAREFAQFDPLVMKDDTVVVANSASNDPGQSDVYWFKNGQQIASYPSTDRSFALMELADRVVVQATKRGQLNWFKDGKLLKSFSSGSSQISEKTSIAKLSDETIVMAIDTKVFWVKNGELIDVAFAGSFVNAVLKSKSSDEVTVHTSEGKLLVYKAPHKLAEH